MGDGKRKEPAKAEVRKLALKLLSEQSTMTLATAGVEGAWAAPVYYVFVRSAFFFFSDPQARHIREALASGQAAAAIYAPASSWQGICGIQMAGRLDPVDVDPGAARIIRAYIGKFGFTREFFAPGEELDLGAFFKRFRVRLYRFEPGLLYYLDNGIRFGFREEVNLGTG